MAERPGNTRRYRGRFAPSPTGPLHLGSLLAAVLSFLRARRQHGEWLLRMEDIDQPRIVPDAADAILCSLETHGFEWDGSVSWQSRRLAHYEAAERQLAELGHVYPCSCTRQEIRRNARPGLAGPVYAGTCRTGANTDRDCARRFRIETSALQFTDRCHGALSCDPAQEVGDVIIKRRDGLFAYLLACTVDDAESGITEIVRGDDILGFTPAQICLQQALALPLPDYAHFPVVNGPDGRKLSKQNGAPALDDSRPSDNLIAVLAILGVETPVELAGCAPAQLWAWLVEEAPDPLPECEKNGPARPISELVSV